MHTISVRILKITGFLTITLNLIALSLVPLQTAKSTDPSLLTCFLVTTPNGKTIQSIGTIQEAINTAENGSTIQVPSGTYYEHVVINKTVSLIGEENFTSVVDGGNNGTVVEITANDVFITGFKVQNSGYGWDRNGIYAHNVDNCTVKHNYLFNVCHNIKIGFSHNSQVIENTINGTMISPTMYGIRIENSTNCIVAYNNVSDCVGSIHLQNATYCTVTRNYLFKDSQGIRLYSPCTYNNITENTICNNTYDGMVSIMPTNNTLRDNRIFHNNFINNTNPFIIQSNYNIWDDGYPAGGNYWSRYNGTDLNKGAYQNETGSDDIGDTPYAINTYDKDRYPLMRPYNSVRNLNSTLTYQTIQSAINAPETLEGHVILVGSGTYHEHVVVNKTLSLVGEEQTATVIDGGKTGTVLTVNADSVTVTGFAIRNGGPIYPPWGNDCGIILEYCSGANITDNLVTENRIGIYLYYSTNNNIQNNIVHSNQENGVWLWFSGNNTLKENKVFDNRYNFGVFGADSTHFYNTIDTSNTVDQKPVQYLVKAENKVFDNQANTSTLYLISCTNVTVRNLNLSKNGHGVFCYNTTHSRIENVTTFENNYGIYFQNSKNNSVNNNHCTDNWVGICLQGSDYNTVENNTASSSEKAFSLYEANNNNLTGNSGSNSLYGIRLYASNNNKIHHNNLINNTEQASLITCYQNSWDDGFEGNFWSSYNCSDVNRDGIGDEPHIIDSNNFDHYPLFGIFHNFSVINNETTCYVMVITNSTILNFAFEDSNNTVKLTVNGSDETYGFCRICIPHTLLQPEITVMIDAGATEPLYANYSLHDNGSFRWLYFAYQHTTHEITIIPESWLPLSFCTLIFVTLWCLLNRKQFSKSTC